MYKNYTAINFICTFFTHPSLIDLRIFYAGCFQSTLCYFTQLKASQSVFETLLGGTTFKVANALLTSAGSWKKHTARFINASF